MTGFKCNECLAEWNVNWGTTDNVCPNCISDKIKKLNRTVPFKLNDGLPPDYVYHCICGKIFQRQPEIDFDPYIKDIEKIKKHLIIKCPFCKRTNDKELNWYIP